MLHVIQIQILIVVVLCCRWELGRLLLIWRLFYEVHLVESGSRLVCILHTLHSSFCFCVKQRRQIHLYLVMVGQNSTRLTILTIFLVRISFVALIFRRYQVNRQIFVRFTSNKQWWHWIHRFHLVITPYFLLFCLSSFSLIISVLPFVLSIRITQLDDTISLIVANFFWYDLARIIKRLKFALIVKLSNWLLFLLIHHYGRRPILLHLSWRVKLLSGWTQNARWTEQR